MTTEVSDELKQKKRDALAKARAAKAEKKKQLAYESEDPEALQRKRAELLAELAKLPDPAPVATGQIPGTLVKDGLGIDKIPWTPARLRQACNNNEHIPGIGEFSWKTVLGDGKIISVSWNGIVYWLWPERENKIPSVHYAVYMQALEDRRKEVTRWRGPSAPGPSDLDGYNSAEAHAADIGSASNLGHIMGVGPLEPRGE